MDFGIQIGKLGAGSVVSKRWLVVTPCVTMMESRNEFKPPAPVRVGKLSNHVAMRTHGNAVPAGKVRVPKCEVIMVNRNGARELGAGSFDRLSPLFCVESLASESRDDFLVTVSILITEILSMVLKGGVVRFLHLVAIPLGIAGRERTAHGHGPPVGINAELGVTKPFRITVGMEGGPVRLKRPCGNERVNLVRILREIAVFQNS